MPKCSSAQVLECHSPVQYSLAPESRQKLVPLTLTVVLPALASSHWVELAVQCWLEGSE